MNSPSRFLINDHNKLHFKLIEIQNFIDTTNKNHKAPTIENDLILFGFLLGKSSHYHFKENIKIEDFLNYISDKILYINHLYYKKVINFRQKLHLCQILIESQVDKINENIDKELNYYNGNGPLRELIESSIDSRSLSKDLVQELLSEKRKLLKSNNVEDICDICFRPMIPSGKNTIIFKTCSHSFHNYCLKSYIVSEIEKECFPIECPSEKCEKIIEFPLLFEEFNDGTISNYYKFNFRNHLIEQKIKPVFKCSTNNCLGLFSKVYPFENTCYFCHKKYCLKCCNLDHKQTLCNLQESCERDMEEIKEFEFFFKCLKCKFWNEKSSTSNIIVCLCSAHYCFQCRKELKDCQCPQEKRKLGIHNIAKMKMIPKQRQKSHFKSVKQLSESPKKLPKEKSPKKTSCNFPLIYKK